MPTDQPTPGPWRWETEKEPLAALTDMGSIVGADGRTVCWFGDDEMNYPTNGDPPSKADLALILRAPELQAEVERLRGALEDDRTIFGGMAKGVGLTLARDIAERRLAELNVLLDGKETP